MSRRIEVSSGCARRCTSCVACRPDQPDTAIDAARALAGVDELVLGGGDATRWPHLHQLLEENLARPRPQRLWIEAPAASLTTAVLAGLARRGLHGVRVYIEAAGEQMCRALGVGDGEKAIADAEAAGLVSEARVAVRPRTFRIAAPLAARLRPRTVWLEIVRQDRDAQPSTIPHAAVERLLLASPNLRFASHRLRGAGYLPPCVMPEAWRRDPSIWRSTFDEGCAPNQVLPACAACSLADRCTFSDGGALSDEATSMATPVARQAPMRRIDERPVPEVITSRRGPLPVVCSEPWTTMELSDPDGRVRQCGGNWTEGDRGNIFQDSLIDIWNGPGYQEARRVMAGGQLGDLCRPVCIRLHDGKLHERELRIQQGTPRFVENQLLLAEEMAERREVMRSLPLHMTISPSTYCNYDCIFCDFGRTPRRDMPESVWDELPRFLPTLKTLTLLGGEPLASPRVWHFLRELDTDLYPDVRIDIFTNGALMTDKALRQIRKCSLGEVTVSLNAGTDEIYRQVERGIDLASVMENVDALIRYRSEQPFWFGITLSFIVQSQNAHTMIAFGELAHARNLHIRLVALNVQNFFELNFYRDPEEVVRVIAHVDEFGRWAARVRPEWLPQVAAVREAILGEARRRQADELIPLRRRANSMPLKLVR